MSPSREYINAKRVPYQFTEHDLRSLATRQAGFSSAVMQAWSKHSHAQRLTSLLVAVFCV